MNIYVGNLPYNATEENLRREFGQFGTVTSVSIVIDRETGRPRGFGFVEMSNDDDAEQAIKGMNGTEFMGRVLTVNSARPREARDPREVRQPREPREVRGGDSSAPRSSSPARSRPDFSGDRGRSDVSGRNHQSGRDFRHREDHGKGKPHEPAKGKRLHQRDLEQWDDDDGY